MEPVQVTLPVTVTLQPLEIAAVIKGLDELPHRIARPIIDKLFAAAKAAHTPADEAAA